MHGLFPPRRYHRAYLLHSPHPDIIHLRKNSFLDKIRKTRTSPPWLHPALAKLSKAAWNTRTSQGERYWTAHISSSQLADAYGHTISPLHYMSNNSTSSSKNPLPSGRHSTKTLSTTFQVTTSSPIATCRHTSASVDNTLQSMNLREHLNSTLSLSQ